MEYSVMEQYWIWLSSVEGIGPKRFYRLLSVFEDARDVWENAGDPRMDFLGQNVLNALKKARSSGYFDALFSRMAEKDIRAVTRLSGDYPKRLTHIYDAPPHGYVVICVFIQIS